MPEPQTKPTENAPALPEPDAVVASPEPGDNGSATPKDAPPAQEPQAGHKLQERMNQFTRRLSAAEDKTAEAEKLHEADSAKYGALVKQYDELSSTLEGVEDRVSDGNAPDPSEDPVGYANYREDRMLKKVNKAMAGQASQSTPAPAQPQAQPQKREISVQEAVQAAIHEDYYDAIAITNEDMRYDSLLVATLGESADRFKAAYDHGKKRMDMKTQSAANNANRAYAEGGSPTAPTGDVVLSSVDMKMIANLRAGGSNITEEGFLKNKKRIMNRKRK